MGPVMAHRNTGLSLLLSYAVWAQVAEKKCPLQGNISLPRGGKLLLLRSVGAGVDLLVDDCRHSCQHILGAGGLEQILEFIEA